LNDRCHNDHFLSTVEEIERVIMKKSMENINFIRSLLAKGFFFVCSGCSHVRYCDFTVISTGTSCDNDIVVKLEMSKILSGAIEVTSANGHVCRMEGYEQFCCAFFREEDPCWNEDIAIKFVPVSQTKIITKKSFKHNIECER